MTIKEGNLATDILEEDQLYVVEVTETPISEQVAKYDYDMNPVTVYDLEKDKDYACQPDDIAVMVVYPNILEQRIDSKFIDTEQVEELIENRKIKPYYFPQSRLKQD